MLLLVKCIFIAFIGGAHARKKAPARRLGPGSNAAWLGKKPTALNIEHVAGHLD